MPALLVNLGGRAGTQVDRVISVLPSMARLTISFRRRARTVAKGHPGNSPTDSCRLLSISRMNTRGSPPAYDR